MPAKTPGPLLPRPSLLTNLIGRPTTEPTGDPSEGPGLAVVPETGKHDAVQGPIFDYELEFFAHLTAGLDATVIGDTPDGYRINFLVLHGRVQGPDIDATIRPGGTDHMCIRSDGTGVADVAITYETTDGALIFNESGGVCQFGTDCLARIRQGEFSGTAPFYPTPRWSTASPKWSRLNGVQGFGLGMAHLDSLDIAYDMYIPRVKARLDS